MRLLKWELSVHRSRDDKYGLWMLLADVSNYALDHAILDWNRSVIMEDE